MKIEVNVVIFIIVSMFAGLGAFFLSFGLGFFPNFMIGG